MTLKLKMKDLATGQDWYLWRVPSRLTYICKNIGTYGAPAGSHEAFRLIYIRWVRSQKKRALRILYKSVKRERNIKAHIRNVLVVKEPYFYFE